MQPGTNVLFNSKRYAKFRRIPKEWTGYMHCTVHTFDDSSVVLRMPVAIVSADRNGNPVRLTELRLIRNVELYPADFPDEPWDEASEQYVRLQKPLPTLDVLQFLRIK